MVGAGGFQFVAAAVAEEDADRLEAVCDAAFDVVVTVADHNGLGLIGNTGRLQRVGDDVGLERTGAVHGGAADMVEVLGQIEMVEDLSGIDLRLGGGQNDRFSGLAQILQHFGYAVEDGIFKNAFIGEIDAVVGHGLEGLFFIKAIEVAHADVQGRADEIGKVLGSSMMPYWRRA